MRIRIGTRASNLARAQTGHVAEALAAATHAEVEIVHIRTRGDDLQKYQGAPTPNLGVGLFTKALQEALLRDEIDLAVHSLKDLPCETAPGFHLAAIPPRVDPADALVARDGLTFEALPKGASVGTGSPRRRALLALRRPDLDIRAIRGNIETRMGRLEETGERRCDAVVLAYAGLLRTDQQDRMTDKLEILPAPGQGALGLEVRADDTARAELVAQIDDSRTRLATAAERRLHQALGGGCLAPFGALATITDGRIHLEGCVASMDGKRSIRGSAEDALERLEDVVAAVAKQLLDGDAKDILEEARRTLEAIKGPEDQS